MHRRATRRRSWERPKDLESFDDGNVAALMKPYVETNPIGVVWVALAVIAGVIELAGAARRREEATKKDRGSRFVLRICVVPAVLVAAASPKIAPAAEIRPPLVPIVVGMVVFATGEALRVWAKVALGRYFTYTVMTSSDQAVITSGPYRYVRHPSYTGIPLSR
jgi:protein-S-isoprenylcysteine O-methyltransferase Ste14